MAKYILERHTESRQDLSAVDECIVSILTRFELDNLGLKSWQAQEMFVCKNIQTSSGTHAASSSMGNGALYQE
jgi:hypothetical protein